ncbi:hypothetical protein F2Q70_00035602 [Brassica cretica]|uniref:Uncharacterized protein n=1 Tax=Brassica cretica TaxID=69181 RepID=A0A8S9JQI0_BRACR|nr:hypothetical protein F2Q70_00035602 [Brassica cretica]
MSNYELKFRFTSALEKTAHVTYNEGINVKRKKCKRERLMISEGSRLEYVEAGTYLRMHVHPKRSPSISLGSDLRSFPARFSSSPAQISSSPTILRREALHLRSNLIFSSLSRRYILSAVGYDIFLHLWQHQRQDRLSVRNFKGLETKEPKS